MNLSTNAGHAMQDGGGVLRLELMDVEIDSKSASEYPGLRSGPYIRLTVSDTGHGIPHDVQTRIFDPFFTTKGNSEGTGLGLSVVHGIVKSWGGDVKVVSEPNSGSSFIILIPATKAVKHKFPSNMKDQETLSKGSEHVLFVDDEPSLVELGKRMLSSLGYTLTVAYSGTEALDLFKAHPDRFDLVITDLTMPKMTGLELARELIAVRSDIPIILCTGYSIKRVVNNPEETDIQADLMKPIILNELAETIRTVLDTKKSTALSLEKYGSDDPVVQPN